MSRVVLIGGGGNCAAVIDAMRSADAHEIIGVLDVTERVGSDVLGVPVIGIDDDLAKMDAYDVDGFVITLGSTGDTSVRRQLYAKAIAAGLAPVSVVHASSVVSPSATLGGGVFVGAFAYVGPRASIGPCAIVNSHASVDHDCSIGEFAHIAPGAVLSGGVTVGASSHVGTGASVSHGVTIGTATVIGVGSAVVSDIGNEVTAYGNPCREAEK